MSRTSAGRAARAVVAGTALAALAALAAVAGPAAVAPVAAGESVSITLPPDRVALAPGPGADVAQTQCAFCHSLDYVTMQPRGPAAQWQGVVTKMIKVFGAPISDADAKAIADYLAAKYGP